MNKPTAYDKPVAQSMGMRFADMTRRQKWIFSAKLIACICTFGFAFPTVQTD